MRRQLYYYLLKVRENKASILNGLQWSVTVKDQAIIPVAKELISEYSDRTAFDRVFNKSILWPSAKERSFAPRGDGPRDVLKREARIKEIKKKLGFSVPTTSRESSLSRRVAR